MIISETTDMEMLKRMEAVAASHVTRCLNQDSEDFNHKKAREVGMDLVAIRIRIKELTN